MKVRMARTLSAVLCAVALSTMLAQARTVHPAQSRGTKAPPTETEASQAAEKHRPAVAVGPAKLPSSLPPRLPLPAKPRGIPLVNELGRAPKPDIPGPVRIPGGQTEPLKWASLDGWSSENHAEVFSVFRTSCKPVIGVARANNDPRPVLHALASVCRRALALNNPDAERARQFFEDNFVPVRINKLGDATGFLTGYYEPVVEGSRFPTQIFKVPVYRRPPDLIPPPGYVKGQGFPNTGQSTRKDADGKIVPYYERGDIENGALDGQHLEICWLKDPVDLFYIQIQGSARVRLEDGTVLRINYDSHNGHPYTAIGRILIERKEVPREEMSMDRIRQWMAAAPDGGKELRSHNKGYVFFRVVGLSGEKEAPGAQGIPLTALRSIAVDKALHVYGTPFFIEAELPINSSKSDTKFRRTMIAQDTGSAIVGAARADIYYGAGDVAGKIAGRIKNPGKFAMLIPRELDPVVAGAAMPLPFARPNVEEILARIERNRVAGDKAPREQTADKTEKAPDKTPDKSPPGTPPGPKGKSAPVPDSKSEQPRAKVRG
jgi:membrane-bound lytic murein transglycosylase A